MGRKAKLKKNRQDPSQAQSKSEPTQFVKQLQRQGYNLQQVQRSPELPDDNPEPQV